MTNNPNEPRIDDAVLGGTAPAPAGGVVLGGIEGVKRRFASAFVEQRKTALVEALKYGEAGLDLAIAALNDRSKQVSNAAYLLLRNEDNPKIQQTLNTYLAQKILIILRDYRNGKRNFVKAELSGADLSGADLSGANLRWANLRWANLRGAILSEANLSGANLSGVNLSGFDLSGFDLSGANLSEANLRGANLIDADLSGAKR